MNLESGYFKLRFVSFVESFIQLHHSKLRVTLVSRQELKISGFSQVCTIFGTLWDVSVFIFFVLSTQMGAGEHCGS